MFYHAYIFYNVDANRFSKVKIKLKLFKGHRGLLPNAGLFPTEVLVLFERLEEEEDSFLWVSLSLFLFLSLQKGSSLGNPDEAWPSSVCITTR